MTTRQAHIDEISGQPGAWLLDPATSTYQSLGGSATRPGFYGQFYDVTATQIAAFVETPQRVTIGQTDGHNGVTLAGNVITIANAGVYNVQWSAQYINTDAKPHVCNLFPKHNGITIPDSSGYVSVMGKDAGVNGKAIASWNVLLNAAAGSTLEFWWDTDSLSAYLATIPADGDGCPRSPCMIVTVQQVYNTQTYVGDALVLPSIDDATVTSPPAGNFALFFDSSNGNALSYKDSVGVVHLV